MNTFQETNLFRLLTETSKAGHSDVDFLSNVNIACNEFADQLSEYCVTQSNDAAFAFRALSYASINLESLQAEIACLELEKKCANQSSLE